MADQMLTWIHLSDLHMQSKDAFDRDVVLKALWKDIEGLREDGLRPDFAVFTGDVAYHGKASEYKLAEEFFDQLLAIAELGKERLYIVPGNHDADWSITSDLKAPVVEAERNIREILEDGRRRELFLQPFAAYRDFVRSYLPVSQNLGNPAFAYSQQFEKSGHSISLIGLNTAWLSGFHVVGEKRDDRGHLAIGEFQAAQVLPSDSDITIAVMHHPLSWLWDFDEIVTAPLLTRNCSIILRGHMHHADVIEHSSLDGRILVIPSGAVFESRSLPNVYNVVRVNLRTREGEVHIRQYNDRRWEWQKGSELTGDAADGKARIRLPEPSSLQKPQRRRVAGDAEGGGSPGSQRTPVQQDDLSSQVTLAQVFPLSGRTRIVYTCRSRIEVPAFDCPSRAAPLAGALVVASHIPVDEFETCGLCVAWYGQKILGTEERVVGDSLICSDQAIDLHGVEDSFALASGAEVDQALMDNLIVVGENAFANRLFRLVCHQLPWRHYVTQVVEVRDPLERDRTAEPRYHTRLTLTDDLRSAIDPGVILDLKDSTFAWSLVTYVPNPFAPDKRLLFLLGCHRVGQYALLSWLRSRSLVEAADSIAKCRAAGDSRFFQIVVKSDPARGTTRGQVQREWRTINMIQDVSGREPVPFFTENSTRRPAATRWGESVTDLSVLAVVPRMSETVRGIEETIPEALREMFERELQNGSVGLHVTLYEFLHTMGFKDRGLVDELMDPASPFLAQLGRTLENAPLLRLRFRQTRLTQFSLQVLADLQCEVAQERLEAMGFSGPETEGTLTAMDLVIGACRRARASLPERRAKRLNISRAPMPLHLTLLRLGQHPTEQQREAVEHWAAAFRSRIWGPVLDPSLVLAYARKHPYLDVVATELRKGAA